MATRGLKICVDCPVKQECLDFALSFPQAEDMHGVYGGTTAKDRRAIRNGTVYMRKPSGPPRQIITGLDD
jgi:hypothetical protein